MVDEAKKEEQRAQDTVDIAQELEGVLLLYLLGKIKTSLESTKTSPDDLADIRKEISKEVGIYLPLLITSSNKVLDNNYKNVVNELEGNIPKYTDSVAKEVEKYWKKYIKTKGNNFVVGKNQKLSQYFTNTVDKYIKEIVDGSTTVQDCIDKVVNELAESGLKVIDYDSGITRQIDVWARQQVLYAQKKSTQDIRDKFAKDNGITIFEFDAHPNARYSHQEWQGKRYDETGKYYPTLNELTHGEHLDYNCRHRAFPVFNKDDPYMYTKEQLDNINTKPFTFKGKVYDGYEGTQLMRKYERDIRALKRKKYYKESIGEDVTDIETRIKKKNKEYKEIVKKMNTYARNDRLKVVYY